MPEYLAPGVYVEEVSFRPKSIEGVSTSTTAFVGPTRKGPLLGTPEVMTSFGEFTRIYGGLNNLVLRGADNQDREYINYMAHAVRAFFDNGGARLYIGRVYSPIAAGGGFAESDFIVGDANNGATFRARMAGSGLNGVIHVFEKRTPAADATLNSAELGSLLLQREGDAGDPAFFRKAAAGWLGTDGAATPPPVTANTQRFLVTVNLEAVDADGNSWRYEDLGFFAEHPRYIGAVLVAEPSRRGDQLEAPYFLRTQGNIDGFALRTGLFSRARWELRNGNDGLEPSATDADANALSYNEALATLELIEDISIIAAPGHSALPEAYRGVQDALISHAARMKYRIAVLDTRSDLTPGAALQERSNIDSKYAALYYPWVVIPNPLARPGNDRIPKEIKVPPSGFISGIYARNDVQRGVWKAPANESVRGALRFEREINHAQQETLNPYGVNCLRYFFGRGYLVWGARLTSSDPEWKYVNVRRYFNYLERSIDRSTQWAVFEPNGERLWANIRETVSSFLYSEWRNGALLGATPEEAYFVRCDRSTMTQNDLDNGRLICEIGVAVLYPAEFVIFRIGQKTADARA